MNTFIKNKSTGNQHCFTSKQHVLEICLEPPFLIFQSSGTISSNPNNLLFLMTFSENRYRTQQTESAHNSISFSHKSLFHTSTILFRSECLILHKGSTVTLPEIVNYLCSIKIPPVPNHIILFRLTTTVTKSMRGLRNVIYRNVWSFDVITQNAVGAVIHDRHKSLSCVCCHPHDPCYVGDVTTIWRGPTEFTAGKRASWVAAGGKRVTAGRVG